VILKKLFMKIGVKESRVQISVVVAINYMKYKILFRLNSF